MSYLFSYWFVQFTASALPETGMALLQELYFFFYFFVTANMFSAWQ